MSGELAFFYLLAALMVGSALAMVLARNLVHGVLFMVANFVLTAVAYLLLQAPFIAAVQLIVYAGAIMVLFLFVVMVLGNQELSLSDRLAGHRIIGAGAVLILGMLLAFVVKEGAPATAVGGLAETQLPGLAELGGAPGQAPATPGEGAFGSPQMIGQALYADPYHLLPFELVSLLLLVAMMGAVIITRAGKEERRAELAAEQEPPA